MFQQQLEAFAGIYALAESELDDSVQLIVRLDFLDSVGHGRGIADRSEIRPRSQNVSVGEIKSAGFTSCRFHRLFIGLPFILGNILERCIQNERQADFMTRLHQPRLE